MDIINDMYSFDSLCHRAYHRHIEAKQKITITNRRKGNGIHNGGLV